MFHRASPKSDRLLPSRGAGAPSPLVFPTQIAKPFPQLEELRDVAISCHSRIVDKLADVLASADAAIGGDVAE